MGACSLSRVSPFSPLWEGPWIMPLQSPPSLFLACGLLQLFQSSKDPPVFSSKEPFDVLNDKARHHRGFEAAWQQLPADTREGQPLLSALGRFWPSEVFCFRFTWTSLLSELPLPHPPPPLPLGLPWGSIKPARPA